MTLERRQGAAIVAGTFDTKEDELLYIAEQLMAAGVPVRTVDLSTRLPQSSADVKPTEVAACHPDGAKAVDTGDRGSAVAAMSIAFENWVQANLDSIAGIISAGGTGGTALASPAMRSLPVGVPKVLISTVASGDVGPYVGPSDMTMMYSVTDVQGLNPISRQVLGNGAAALAGMISYAPKSENVSDHKTGLGLTMFGVTTTAVQAVVAKLESDYEPYVFHATGVGGRSMEKLIDSGFITRAIDLTTTEICDLLMGGVFQATEDRFGSIIRTKIPYVGSVGALDMVNFGAPPTVPEKYAGRLFYEHNPQVTLMRTTPEENKRMGEWIVAKLNLMEGPVRFLLPEGGLSALDAPDMPFWDTEARTALYDAIRSGFKETENRKLITAPHHINDPDFAELVVNTLREIN
ncbi:MAG: Tm-1-like ATP-binding domain-containing protein [Hyphomicrobiales bacterium]